jgi:DNA-binding beta-propeller fold protein YncE
MRMRSIWIAPSAAALAICSSACNDQSSAEFIGDEATVYAVGTDNSTVGILSRMSVPGLSVEKNLMPGAVSVDPVLRYHDGLLYVVNRFGADNITVIEPRANQLVGQISTGAGTNPQDVAVRGDDMYVAALGARSIIKLNAATLAVAPSGVDISSYDVDGVPDANSIVLVDGKLYASIGMLDQDFQSHGGKVLVIDAQTDQIVDELDLVYANPVTLLQTTPASSPFAGDLITATNDYNSGEGCVERITPGDRPQHRGCLIDNRDLGGTVSSIAFAHDMLWLAVGIDFEHATIVAVNEGGEIVLTVPNPQGQNPTDLTACPTGHLVSNDRAAGGLRVFHSDGTELSTRVIDIGLPPAFTGGLVCL